MTPIIIIAGYTKSAYIHKIKASFAHEDVRIVCVYQREPISEVKQKYLTLFDESFNLKLPDTAARLQAIADSVVAITCTQERDIETYLLTLVLCKKITSTEHTTYQTVINKYQFKESLSKVYPELVPKVAIVDDELLQSPGTLTYPQVVKPTGLAGSILVNVVHNPEELELHYKTFSQSVKDIAETYYNKAVSLITEEYITGPQYSVNVYIDANGRATFCPIVRVVTPLEAGINDTYSLYQYTTNELSDIEIQNLETAVQNIIDHFKIHTTSAHFDSVLCNGQWKFFEVGLRIGGKRQKLFELSHGMDHFLNDIKNRLGQAVSIPNQKKFVCIVQTAAQKNGWLTQIQYTRTITADGTPLIQEDKLAKLHKAVMPVSQGGGTITRHFVTGKDLPDVLATSQALRESITFDIQ